MRALAKHVQGAVLVALSATALAGCAGGWKNGAPPGSDPAVRAVGSSATASESKTPGSATASAATTATAEGVRFAWSGGGNQVNLGGEFNAWSQDADPMQKQADSTFALVKNLAPGRYEYKFVVDGVWKEDPTAKEFVDDPYGGKNSIIVVGDVGTGTAPAPGTPSAGVAASGAAAPVAGATGAKGKAPEVTPDGVRFTFAGGALSVFLAGDFNQWSTTTDPLARQADGTWTIVKKIPAGRYTYKFFVNGSTWKPDDSNPESESDPFGGKNSVLVVP